MKRFLLALLCVLAIAAANGRILQQDAVTPNEDALGAPADCPAEESAARPAPPVNHKAAPPAPSPAAACHHHQPTRIHH